MNNIHKLGLGFFIIFFAYNSVQQFLTVIIPIQGLIFLASIYIFVSISNLFVPIIISRIEIRSSLVFPTLAFSMFIFSLYFEFFPLIIFSGIILGISVPFLWISENIILIESSSKKDYGKNAGLFTVLFHSGNIAGIIALSFIIKFLDFKDGLLLFGFLPLFSILFLKSIEIKDKKTKDDKIRNVDLNKEEIKKLNISFKEQFSCFKDITLIKLSLNWFLLFFSIGITFSYMPNHITKILDPFYAGILSLSFYISPLLFSFFIGKISDMIGRKKVILFSYTTIGLSMILFLFSKELPLLIAGIIFLSIGCSSAIPMTQSLIGDITTSKTRIKITGFMMSIQHLGIVASIILSLLFKDYLFFIVALVIIIISAIAVFPLLSKIDEKKIIID